MNLPYYKHARFVVANINARICLYEINMAEITNTGIIKFIGEIMSSQFSLRVYYAQWQCILHCIQFKPRDLYIHLPNARQKSFRMGSMG